MSAAGTGLHVRGRAWVFGDEVNTDEMFPGFANRLPIKEAAQTMFNASRPSWPALVRPGDIVVAGRNFGLGSSRPVALLFQQLGVSALLAEHINSLFFRNSINYGLAALTVPGITAHVTEGDELVVDVTAATVVNIRTDTQLTGAPLPEFLLSILRAGGLSAQLERAGHLRAPVPIQPAVHAPTAR